MKRIFVMSHTFEGAAVKVFIAIEVPDDWVRQLDMQQTVEREVKADRWAWHAVPTLPEIRKLLRDAIVAAEGAMSPLADRRAMRLFAIEDEHKLWQGIETLAVAAGVKASDEAQRAATRAEVLSDVDPVVLEAWRLQGHKVGAMLRESQTAVIELQEKLDDAADGVGIPLKGQP